MINSVQLGGTNPPTQELAMVSARADSSSFSATAATSTLSPTALLAIALQVGESLKSRSKGLDYHVDMINGAPRIRIIDSQTMQIIRQIPSDEVLTVHRALKDVSGFLIRQNA